MAVLVGWIKCWWHCLTHFHRMSDAKEHRPSLGWRTIWIGCGDCEHTTYGKIPDWWRECVDLTPTHTEAQGD